jgi:hypothetical protein
LEFLELLPVSERGLAVNMRDLVINSTFWIGAFLGSLGSVLPLHMKSIPVGNFLGRRRSVDCG